MQPAGDAPRQSPSVPRERPDAPLPVVFDHLRAAVRKVNPGLSGALEGGRLLECGEGVLRIAVPRSFAARRIEDRRVALEEIFGRFFGCPTTFSVESGNEAQNGTISRATDLDPESLRLLRQHALDNPGVNAVLEVLQGEIVEIRPLTGGFSPHTGDAT